MAKKSPKIDSPTKQVSEKQTTINHKTVDRSFLIPVLITGLYMLVHFIGTMNAIDVMGPQWLFLALLDASIVIYIWINKHLYQEVILQIWQQLYSKIYLSLFLLAGLSTFFAMNATESWVCFVRFIITIVAFFNLAILYQGRIGLFRMVAQLLTIILFIESIQYLFRFSEGIKETALGSLINSLNGNTGNKNIFAASLVLKIPFLLYVLYNGKIIERIFYIITLTLGITVIFMVSARASYVSLLLVTLIFIGFLVFEYLKTKKIEPLVTRSCYLLLPIIAAFFIAQAIYVQVAVPQENNAPTQAVVVNNNPMALPDDAATRYGNVINNISSISVSNNASSYRFKLWEHAGDYILKHPFMGCGYGNWKLASIPYEKEYINDLYVPAHAHNDFLEHAAELGILGGLLYLALYVSLFLTTLKTLRSKASEETKLIALFSFIAFIVYAVDAALNFPMERPIMQVFFACITAFNLSAFIQAKKETLELTPIKAEKKSLTHTLYGLTAILILLPAAYVSYLTYVSLKAQMRVIPDLKNEPMTIPLAEAKNMFPSIPNLTSSSQPIDAILGRYYSENKQYDEALRLLRKAIPHNPDIYYSQFLMANVFFFTGQLDSAKHYAEMAYYNKPRANTYYQTLMAVQAKRRDTTAIGKAFRNYIRYRNEPFAWNLYLSAMLNAQQRGTTELLQFADSALRHFDPKGLYPANETDYANLLKRREEIASNLNFTGTVAASPEETAALIEKATLIYNEGVAAFSKQDYKTAAAKFVQAAKVNAFNYAIYENAGVSYFNLKDYRKAIVYFDKVIALNISKDGKSEFFKGVSLINLGNKEAGCKILQVAKAKNYMEANNIIAQYCN